MYCGFEPCRVRVITVIIVKADLVKISYFAVREIPRSVSVNSLWL